MRFKSKQDLSALTKFHNQLKQLSGLEVTYGYYDDETHYSGLTMAHLAAIHEFGWNNLPERNFIYSTQLSFRNDLNKHIKSLMNDIIAGKGSTSGLNRIGKSGVEAIKFTIDAGTFSNNKVSDNWAKVKGFSDAMIHYGDLQDATKFKVGKRTED